MTMNVERLAAINEAALAAAAQGDEPAIRAAYEPLTADPGDGYAALGVLLTLITAGLPPMPPGGMATPLVACQAPDGQLRRHPLTDAPPAYQLFIQLLAAHVNGVPDTSVALWKAAGVHGLASEVLVVATYAAAATTGPGGQQ